MCCFSFFHPRRKEIISITMSRYCVEQPVDQCRSITDSQSLWYYCRHIEVHISFSTLLITQGHAKHIKHALLTKACKRGFLQMVVAVSDGFQSRAASCFCYMEIKEQFWINIFTISLMSPSSTSCLPRFIGMKFKAVTFIDSSFLNCYFEDVSSVGSLFKNCTFVDSFFYNTGASLSEARLFYSISGNWLAEGTHISLIFSPMPNAWASRSSGIGPRSSVFDHLWLCFVPLNYSLTSLPLHRLPSRTQGLVDNSETEPDF